METLNGLLFKVTGEELAKSYIKQAEHHATRRSFYEGKLAEWKALPPETLPQLQAVDRNNPRMKLLAEVYEGRDNNLAGESSMMPGERMLDQVKHFDPTEPFERKINEHRSDNERYSFLASHVALNSMYTLDLSELHMAGLVPSHRRMEELGRGMILPHRR